MHNFRKIDPLSNQIFEQTLSKVKDQFILKTIQNDIGHWLLLQFEELKKYNSLFVHKNIEFKNNKGSFLILLIEKHLTIREIKGPARNARIQDTESEETEPILIFTIAEDIGKFVLLRTGRNLTEEVLLLLISIGNKIINNKEL